MLVNVIIPHDLVRNVPNPIVFSTGDIAFLPSLRVLLKTVLIFPCRVGFCLVVHVCQT